MNWFYLILAGVFEIGWLLGLKLSQTMSSKVLGILMAIISMSGFYFYGSPSGFLFTIILGIMLRLGHPEPLDTSPLDFKRKAIAILTLLIFILSFVPFPVQIR